MPFISFFTILKKNQKQTFSNVFLILKSLYYVQEFGIIQKSIAWMPPSSRRLTFKGEIYYVGIKSGRKIALNAYSLYNLLPLAQI